MRSVANAKLLARDAAREYVSELGDQRPGSLLLGPVANEIADDLYPIEWDRDSEWYRYGEEDAWHEVSHAALEELRRLLPEQEV